MRKVEVYEYQQVIKEGKNFYDKVLSCEALFHQFGMDYEEFENGAGNYSTAIVELATGEVKNVRVDMIVFIDQPK